MSQYRCPACGGEKNSQGQPFFSYRAVALHLAGKIWSTYEGTVHRNWIRNHAPDVNLSGWSQRKLTWSTMGELADSIYPAVELVLDKEHSQETRDQNISTPTLPLTASELADFRRNLLRILDNVEDERPSGSESVTARINRLSFSGRIPRHVAASMKTITEYRNITEYEAKELSELESDAVRSAWSVIQGWASKEGAR